MRTVIGISEIGSSKIGNKTWPEIVALAEHHVDHIHGVCILDDGEEYIIHLSPEGEGGVNTLVEPDGGWQPRHFSSISLDDWH